MCPKYFYHFLLPDFTKTLHSLFPLVYRVHQVTNPGKPLQTLGSAFLNIMWPYALSNEKWLLYPASLKFEGHPDTHCTPKYALNPLQLEWSSSVADPPQPEIVVSWEKLMVKFFTTGNVLTLRLSVKRSHKGKLWLLNPPVVLVF